MIKKESEAAKKVPKIFHEAVGKPHAKRRRYDWYVRQFLLPYLVKYRRLKTRPDKSRFTTAIMRLLAARFPDLSPKAPQRLIYELDKKTKASWRKVSAVRYSDVLTTNRP